MEMSSESEQFLLKAKIINFKTSLPFSFPSLLLPQLEITHSYTWL